MNKNRVIELCLVFLVSILSFSVGTFVGKKYSDNQHKLALLDPNSTNQAENSHTEVAMATPKDAPLENSSEENKLTAAVTGTTQITDSDVAKMAEEFSDEESKTESANVIKTIEEDGTVIDETKKVITEKVAAKKVEAKKENLARAVATISEKAKLISSDLNSTQKAQYTVQVGSFPTAADAEKTTNSLQARGYKAISTEATISGKKWYRVQVGIFNSLSEAQVYKKELVEQNHIANAIVSRITN